jgi:hypothetical protein
MRIESCKRRNFMFSDTKKLIKELSKNKLIPLGCDLSAIINDKKLLDRLQIWVRNLEGKNQYALLSLSHDTSEPIQGILGNNTFVMRTSMLSNSNYHQECLLPVFIDGRHLSNFDPIPKKELPKVGFMGHTDPARHHKLIMNRHPTDMRHYGYRETDGEEVLRTPVNIGLILRNQLVKKLSASDKIDSDLVSHDTYFYSSSISKQEPSRDYLDHLKLNPYILCVRGSGNYSIRLYEAMAAGRIPIIIDSDCVFPLENEIDWKSISVMVSISEIDSISDIIAEFHESISDNQFLDLQKNIRATWEKYLRPEGYLKAQIPNILSQLSYV